MVGTLSAPEIELVLHEAYYGHLGCHADGKTSIVPVGYAYDGKRVICHSTLGRKIETMRRNSEVCFEVELVKTLGNWRSVIVWGKYVELKDTDAATALGLLIDRLMPVLNDSNTPHHGIRSVTPPSRSGRAGTPVVYAIEITEKTGRFETMEEGA